MDGMKKETKVQNIIHWVKIELLPTGIWVILMWIIQINLGCRGCTGGRLGWEWGCFGGFVSFIMNKTIPRSLKIIYMVIKDLWPSWDAMDVIRCLFFRQTGWFMVGSDLGEMVCQPWCTSMARWQMTRKETKQRFKILFSGSYQSYDRLVYG